MPEISVKQHAEENSGLQVHVLGQFKGGEKPNRPEIESILKAGGAKLVDSTEAASAGTDLVIMHPSTPRDHPKVCLPCMHCALARAAFIHKFVYSKSQNFQPLHQGCLNSQCSTPARSLSCARQRREHWVFDRLCRSAVWSAFIQSNSLPCSSCCILHFIKTVSLSGEMLAGAASAQGQDLLRKPRVLCGMAGKAQRQPEAVPAAQD